MREDQALKGRQKEPEPSSWQRFDPPFRSPFQGFLLLGSLGPRAAPAEAGMALGFLRAPRWGLFFGAPGKRANEKNISPNLPDASLCTGKPAQLRNWRVGFVASGRAL
jgi:hypothetical protein